MPLPTYNSIEMPVLQELTAIGGRDDVRFLYERLIDYFPQLQLEEISRIKKGNYPAWKKAVQKAGRSLDKKKLITRQRGIWEITQAGAEAVADETTGFTLTQITVREVSHADIQQMILEIGEILGFWSAIEKDYYDAVWKENKKSPRYSHVFEVQHRGNIDSAFAKLKRAYLAHRSKPYLILSNETDLNRARRSLDREFQDIEAVITILTFTQIQRVYENLSASREVIAGFLDL